MDILYGYQNDQKYVYDAAVKAGAKGIVVAAAGMERCQQKRSMGQQMQ